MALILANGWVAVYKEQPPHQYAPVVAWQESQHTSEPVVSGLTRGRGGFLLSPCKDVGAFQRYVWAPKLWAELAGHPPQKKGGSREGSPGRRLGNCLMPSCETVDFGDGNYAIICGRRRPRPQKCHYCKRPSGWLCDFTTPSIITGLTGAGHVCDRPICALHRISKGFEVDWCLEHFEEDPRIQAAVAAVTEPTIQGKLDL